MILNLVLSAAAQAAPQAIKDAWNSAKAQLEAALTDNITVNLQVDFSGTGGGAAAGPNNGQFVTYTNVRNYLTTNATPGDSTFTALPATATINGASSVAVWNAQLKLMGLVAANDTTTDDAGSTFATDISASLMTGVALHEFTHAMGRVPYGDASSRPDMFDFFRYNGVGTRLFTGGATATPAFFSLNNGSNKWADYGQTSDPSDTLNPAGSQLTVNDSFNEFYNASTLQTLTPFDLEQLDAIGFHLRQNAPAVSKYDFNGDNVADILVQNPNVGVNQSTGQFAYGSMAGGVFSGWVNLQTTPGFTIVGSGKISGGVSSDVVLQSAAGQIMYANINAAGAFANFVNVANTPGATVVGVGDINRDHYADVVVQDQATGKISYANMANGAFTSWVTVGTTPGFNVLGVGDINFDGFDDIVVQNAGGLIDYANMANGVFTSWGAVANAPGAAVVGVGDINRDGNADVVVQDAAGKISYANMRGGTFQGWVNVVGAPGYKVIAIEDVNGNGYQDIVVQNTAATHEILYANMTTGTFQGWVGGIESSPNWSGHTGPGDDAPAAVSMADPGQVEEPLGHVRMFDPGPLSEAVAPVSMFDPGPAADAGLPAAVWMYDPGPGPQPDNVLAAIRMFDPGPISEVPSPVRMFDPGPQPDAQVTSSASSNLFKSA